MIDLVFKDAPYSGGPIYLVFGETASLQDGVLKVWDGSEWVAGILKRWDGAAWAVNPLKRWDGSEWI